MYDCCAPHSARSGGDKGQVRDWNMTEHIPSVTFVQSTRRKQVRVNVDVGVEQ